MRNACSKYDPFFALSYTFDERSGEPWTLPNLRTSSCFKKETFWALVSSGRLLKTREIGGHVFACGFGGGRVGTDPRSCVDLMTIFIIFSCELPKC